MHRVSLLLEVSEPEEISDGVYKTTLTHPKLQGGLYFVHSHKGGRDEFLKALDENIVSHLTDLIGAVGGLINGERSTPSPASTPGTKQSQHGF